jgi:hypothetical protein
VINLRFAHFAPAQNMEGKLMQDAEYLALVEKYKDAWLEGTMKDTLVFFAK